MRGTRAAQAEREGTEPAELPSLDAACMPRSLADRLGGIRESMLADTRLALVEVVEGITEALAS